mgnify:CR=1 FL=1
MKVWQKPNAREKAEWGCLSSNLDWEEKGGTWFRKDEKGSHFLITAVEGEESPVMSTQPFYAYARWLNKRLEPNEAYSEGLGVLIGSTCGVTIKAVRTKMKGVVEDYVTTRKKDSVCPLPSREGKALSYGDYKRKRTYQKDPLVYMEGFLDGSTKRSQATERGTIYQDGWQHGRDYSIGSCSVPEWLFNNTKEASNG